MCRHMKRTIKLCITGDLNKGGMFRKGKSYVLQMFILNARAHTAQKGTPLTILPSQTSALHLMTIN